MSCRLRRLLLAGLLAGCAGVKPAGSADRVPRDVARLEVQVLPPGAQSGHALALEQPIRTGDQYSLVVESGQAGFLYAVRVPTGGARRDLFSADPSAPTIHAGGRINLPRVDWYEMDDTPGDERLVVVVSRAPLGSEALARQLGRGAAAAEPGAERTRGAEPPPDPPPAKKVGEKDRGTRIHARFRDGMAVLSFPLRHL